MENKKNIFIKQAFILAVASLLVRFIGFIYRLPLTNMLGDEGNGIYSSGFYIYNFFLILSSAGLPVAISKLISERVALNQYTNAKKVFKVSLILAIISGLIACFTMIFLAKWFVYIIQSPKSYYTILTLAPTVFIVAVMSVFRGYFQGFGNTLPTAISQVIEQVFNAVFSVYLAYILVKISVELGAAGGTIGTGIGALAGLIYILFLFIKKIKSTNQNMYQDLKNYKIETTKEIVIKLIKTTLPIITGTAIFSITNLIDMQMVNRGLAKAGVFSESEILSLYGQLTGKYVTLTTLPVSISTALAIAIIPSIASNVVKKEKLVLGKKVTTALRLTMTISIPAAFGMGFLAKEILQLLFPAHPEGEKLLQVGSFSIIFLALCQILTGILQGIDKLKVPAISALIGALVKIPINYFLISIPSINVIGAIISTTFCYIVASFLNLKALKKETRIVIDYKYIFLKPIAASLVMGVVCILAKKGLSLFLNSNFATLLTIFIAMLAYLLTMCFIKGFSKSDLERIPFGNKLINILEKFNLID